MDEHFRRIQIAVLWLVTTIVFLLHTIVEFMDREAVEAIWNMELGTGMLVFMTTLMLLPLLLAIFTALLSYATMLWINRGIGLLFSVFNIYHFANHVTADPGAVHQILILGSGILATGLVALLALRNPES